MDETATCMGRECLTIIPKAETGGKWDNMRCNACFDHKVR